MLLTSQLAFLAHSAHIPRIPVPCQSLRASDVLQDRIPSLQTRLPAAPAFK